jgi:protein phosphatase
MEFMKSGPDLDPDALIWNVIQKQLSVGKGDKVGWIDEKVIIAIVQAAGECLRQDPACLRLTGDFIVVGDLHGDIDSLLRIFERGGYPPKRSYLFLGDYVDRGENSCAVVFLLFALKVLFPQNVYLIRGNHESRGVTRVHGFRKECYEEFSAEMYRAIMRTFDELPLIAILNDIIICVHGGIPNKNIAIDSITKPEREAFSEAMDDLLWSDPHPDVENFEDSGRGRGHLFGKRACLDFLKGNKLQFLIRSHQLCMEGYDYPFGPDGRVLTIFSSCDYCGMMNDSGIVFVGLSRMDAEYFSPVPACDMSERHVMIPEFLLTRHSGCLELEHVEMVTS